MEEREMAGSVKVNNVGFGDNPGTESLLSHLLNV